MNKGDPSNQIVRDIKESIWRTRDCISTLNGWQYFIFDQQFDTLKKFVTR